MVLNKIKDFLNQNDEKYEVLYYKYSKAKVENTKLKKDHEDKLKKHKSDVHEIMANHLINLFQSVETAKQDSFKVKATDKDLQRLLMDVNKVEKDMRSVMKKFSIEEVKAGERFFDPEIHEVASYDDAKGMNKGLILKTVKSGFKYRNSLIKKPKVIVTK